METKSIKLEQGLDQKQAARYLTKSGYKVGAETMRVWRYRGVGPAFVKIGGLVRYRESDLLAFVNGATVQPRKKSKRHRAADNATARASR